MFAFMDQIEKPPLPPQNKTYTYIEPAERIPDVPMYFSQANVHKENGFNEVLRNLSAMYTKYSEEAIRLESKFTDLQVRIETAKSNLKLVKKFQTDRSEFSSRFQLVHGVYQVATVHPVEKVHLLTGNNVLMEFTLEQAEKHLIKSISLLVSELKICEHDLDYLRDQMTTTELNISRVYDFGCEQQAVASVEMSEAPSTSRGQQ